MNAKTSFIGKLINEFRNDETFKNFNNKTFLLIFVTFFVFQLGENVSNVFSYIGVILLLFSIMFVDQDQIIFFYLIFASSNRIINVAGIPFLPVITLVAFARKYIFDSGFTKKVISRDLLIPFIVFFIFSLRYFLITYSFREFSIAFKLLFSFILLDDYLKDSKSLSDLKLKFNTAIFYLAFGISITCFISMIFTSASENVERFSLSEKSGENVLSIYIAICLACILVILLSSNNTNLYKSVMGILLVPMIYVGLLTQSRTFALLIVVCVIWVLIFGLYNPNTRKGVFSIFIILTSVVVLYMIFGKNTSLYRLVYTVIDRFVNPAKDDITGGRTTIWKYYLYNIKNNAFYFLFGSNTLMGISTKSVAHNMFLEMWHAYGLFGVGIIAFIYMRLFFNIKKYFADCGKKCNTLVGILPFICVWIGGMTSHTLIGAMPTIEFFIGCTCIFYAQSDTTYDFRMSTIISKRKSRYLMKNKLRY